MRRLLGIGLAAVLTAFAAPSSAAVVEVLRGEGEVAIPESTPMGEERVLIKEVTLEGEEMDFSYLLGVHGAEEKFSNRWLVMEIRNQYHGEKGVKYRVDLALFDTGGGLVYVRSYSDASGSSSPELELHTLEPETELEFSSVHSYRIAVTVKTKW